MYNIYNMYNNIYFNMYMSIFSDWNTCNNVKFDYNELVKLFEESTKMSKILLSKKYISSGKWKYS